MSKSPQRIGPFEMLAPLGRGGIADVTLARRDGDPVGFELVLKRLREPLREDLRLRALLEEEAHIGRILRHAAIPRPFGVWKGEGDPILVMPFFWGVDLTRIARGGTMNNVVISPTTVAAMIAKAARALHAVHEAHDVDGRRLDWVHRDVSPPNIMLGFDGRVALIDLGIVARSGVQPETARSPEGKASYMSPEQASAGPLDRRSDIFSLGIVLFEFVTGRRRFRRDTGADARRAVLEAQPLGPHELSNVGDALAEVMTRCSMPNPDDRYQTAAELADALEALLSPEDDERALAALAEACCGNEREGLERVTKPGYAGPRPTHDFPTSVLGGLEAGDDERTASRLEDAPQAGASDESKPLNSGDSDPSQYDDVVSATRRVPQRATQTASAVPEESDDGFPLQTGGNGFRNVIIALVVLCCAFLAWKISSDGIGTNFHPDEPAGPQRADFEAEPLPPVERPAEVATEIVSEPPGAWIVVNGVATRRQTPASVALIEAQPNLVTLHHPGHETATIRVESAAGSELSAILAPLPEPEPIEAEEEAAEGEGSAEPSPVQLGQGLVRVVARDVGGANVEAEVLLNGRALPGFTPLDVPVDARQRQHITVRKAGLRDTAAYVTTIPYRDRRSTRELLLEMTADTGSERQSTLLSVFASPPGRTLSLDGEDVGQVTILTLAGQGHYIAEVSAEDHVSEALPITAGLGRFVWIANLAPIITGPATLTITVGDESTLIFGERVRAGSSGAQQLGTGGLEGGEVEAGPWRITLEARTEAGRVRGRFEVELPPQTHTTIAYAIEEGEFVEAERSERPSPSN